MSYQVITETPLTSYKYDEATKTLTLQGNIKFKEIPEGPETLILCNNTPLPKLPNTITKIIMKDDYNLAIELPESLKELKMGYYFNCPIRLPSSLTHLTMGSLFNQPIVLPPNLTQLTMGYLFNHLIELPSNLTHLFIGRDFSFIDKLILPTSLKVFGIYNADLYHKLEKKKDILYVYCPRNNSYAIQFYLNGVTSKEYEKYFYNVDMDYCNEIMNLPEFKPKSEEELLKEQIIQLQKEVAEYKVKCEKIDEIIKKLYQPITNV